MQKSILITGCSSGIGFCAALTLHDRGYRVFAGVRKPQDAEKLTSLGIETLLIDVNDSNSIQAALDSLLTKTGGTLDALFNNAGYVQPGAIEDLSRDMLRAQFETNVFGAMELVQRVIPIMRKQGSGCIIQNTSILGSIAMPYRGAYNASKFALEGFSNTLRQELKNTPIRVAIIAPGPIKTRIQDNAYLHYVDTLQQTTSLHANMYKKMEKFLVIPKSTKDLFTQSPDAVVKKVIRALESRRPSAHYYIGFPAQLFAFLKRILPDRALDWICIRAADAEVDE